MRIVLLLVVAGLKEGELQPWMRLCILWEFKNIRIISKNVRNCMLRSVNIYVCRYARTTIWRRSQVAILPSSAKPQLKLG